MAKESVFGDQAGSVELLWERRERPRSGPKPAHSIEQITKAAIEIADADGLAAVAMQRVASKLGFTKMALYRYVAGRSELIALMIDAALGAPPELADVSGEAGCGSGRSGCAARWSVIPGRWRPP